MGKKDEIEKEGGKGKKRKRKKEKGMAVLFKTSLLMSSFVWQDLNKLRNDVTSGNVQKVICLQSFLGLFINNFPG